MSSPASNAAALKQSGASSPAAQVEPGSPWQPDLRDGTYRNPVLFADYSDPDAIRVGDDYWLTASSFSHVPGLPILHSRDLVNWTLVNHALPRLVPVGHFNTPRHGGGVWAPSLRYHAGKFWLYYPEPDFGLYVLTATDPRGQWSEPTLVCAGRGLIDPCPFWDEDGQAYLIHGWAKSRAGIKNRLTLRRLSADGLKTLDDGVVVIDGDKMEGWQTIEGPKLYRRGEYYFIFAPAGGVAEGYQAVFRARSLYGPYESRVVLHQGGTPINGPHQGAWVDTADGEHWFLHFQDRGAFGRIVHLQPMTWADDGWPRMGNLATPTGEPVLRHVKPKSASTTLAAPATSDDFASSTLARQWQWQANPRDDWYTLRQPGLRLHAVVSEPSLWQAANLLMQKFPAPHFTATTRLTFSAAQAGETAGLVVFGYSYAWLGLRHTDAGQRLVRVECAAAHEGGAEKELANIAAPHASVILRVSVDEQARCTFWYSWDGEFFERIGREFQATQSRWVGAKVGLFARGVLTTAGRGHADFDGFTVTAR